jgi:hypothetical protein
MLINLAFAKLKFFWKTILVVILISSMMLSLFLFVGTTLHRTNRDFKIFAANPNPNQASLFVPINKSQDKTFREDQIKRIKNEYKVKNIYEFGQIQNVMTNDIIDVVDDELFDKYRRIQKESPSIVLNYKTALEFAMENGLQSMPESEKEFKKIIEEQVGKTYSKRVAGFELNHKIVGISTLRTMIGKSDVPIANNIDFTFQEIVFENGDEYRRFIEDDEYSSESLWYNRPQLESYFTIQKYQYKLCIVLIMLSLIIIGLATFWIYQKEKFSLRTYVYLALKKSHIISLYALYFIFIIILIGMFTFALFYLEDNYIFSTINELLNKSLNEIKVVM